MAAGILAIPGIMPSRDRSGRAVTATISVYANQTTTLEPVYTTSALSVAHSQPIESDDAGRFPLIWIDATKTVTLAWTTEDGQTKTVDGLTPSMSADTSIADDAQAALDAIEEFSGDADALSDAVTAAATSATSAATSATSASSFASAASSSATSASTAKTAAETAQTGAQTAQTAAETARDLAKAYGASVPYTWSTTTTDADPGNGTIRANNASLASATVLFFDLLSSAGQTISAWLDSFDDSTTTTNYGTLVLRDTSNSVAIFTISGAVTDGGGYRKVPVAYVAGATTFTNAGAIGVNFARSGDKGNSGAGTGDVLAANNGSEFANKATFRSNVGLAIGSNVQAYNADLAAIAALVSAADKVPYATGSGTWALATLTSVARTLVAQTTQALMRTTGLGMSANGSSLVSAADYAAMRVLLSLVAGTDVQAYSAILAALAGVTGAADKLPYFTGASSMAVTTLSSFIRTVLDDADAATARATLGAEPQGALYGVNTQTSSYTLVIGDAGKLVEYNSASAGNLTIPPNSSVAFPTNTRLDINQYGAGQLTIVAGSGVTIRSSGSKLKLTGQYSGASMWKRATDEWVLWGDITT